MSSWPAVFQYGFFCVALSESMCIFAFGPPSSPYSFPMLFIHSAFLLVLLVVIFCSKSVLFRHPVVSMCLYVS